MMAMVISKPARTALRCGLDRAAVQDGRAGRARAQPTLALLLDHRPGRQIGIMRQGQPARMNQRKALKISRNGYLRCGDCPFISVRYGAQNSHSSSLTSLGYAFRGVAIPSVMPRCIYIVQTFLASSS